MKFIKLLPLLLTGAFFMGACSTDTRFQKISPAQSGIDFKNIVSEDTSFNFLNYLYFYNGGGVAAGDVNNDGLVDLYFTSNQQQNRLYINKGDFRFKDVTEEAGVGGHTDGWTTGVAMADINGDGLLDIYVSNVNYLSRKGKNQLFMNNGDGTFTDQAENYGVDFEGYSVQVAFLDYDKDGDLDMYLLNHSVHSVESYQPVQSREKVDPKSGDRLFRNDGDTFNDVTREAGIFASALGFGLGVTISDVNMDGWPDIYVANDFHEDDYLYINQKDGTFKESIRDAARHTSQFSMSVDIADINNDGALDIAATDMLPDDEEILKISGTGDTYEVSEIKRKFGYHNQYSRNVLQLNRQAGRDGVPVFSDIGYLAGIEATDWSWSGLLADLDNDGLRDFFVANGIFRRPNDLDYIKYISNQEVQRSLQGGINPENLELVKRMPQIKIPNAVFKNNGNLTFTDKSVEWGLGENSYSNGAVYADLDNDGDLDLAINNVNQPALVYRNKSVEQNKSGSYLQFQLTGIGENTSGIGTKIFAYADGQGWILEQSPVRGFQSSVSHLLHLGLGEVSLVDSLVVVWPDDSFQILHNIEVNQSLEIDQKNASGTFVYEENSTKEEEVYFEDITEESGLHFTHSENHFVDFNQEILIPHKLSTQGPPVAVADLNGDGLDDLFVGGARWQPGEIWIQNHDATFRKTNQKDLFEDRLSEDTDAVFFDANGDGAPDLLVASGGSQPVEQLDELLDRLYINDGQGNFTRSGGMPDVYTNTGVTAAGDFDGDGDIDLFIGGRSVAGMYGLNPRSFLLENDGTGRFHDVTNEKAQQLNYPGMVTDAKWVDYDGDGYLDLVLVGEWLPVTIFRNNLGDESSIQQVDASKEEFSVFENVTQLTGLMNSTGWWNTLEVFDVNKDGHPDLVAGNLGLNSYFKASEDEPVQLFLNDFNGDDRIDPIITHYKNGQPYPVASRDRLNDQMTLLRKEYPSYGEFGAKRIDELFNKNKVDSSMVKSAAIFASVILLNNGEGAFEIKVLPREVQFSPVFSFLIADINGDENPDLYSAGNFNGVRPGRGHYDAGYGNLLLGDGTGNFTPVKLNKIGLLIDGEVRDMANIKLANGREALIITKNNSKLSLIGRNKIAD